MSAAMKAMQFRRYGGPDVLEITTVAAPTPGPSQLLVQVAATSINPIDWKRASGAYRLLMPVQFPSIPGYDIAGTVAAVGSGVPGFSVGQRVHARIAEAAGGASAEFAVVGVDVVSAMPDGMTMNDAAALPLAGMTALQALRDGAQLSMSGTSDRVLVVGASGGVGHVAVQIAKAAGAFVVGVCSAKNAALVRSLGADDVVDYAAADPFAAQQPFEVVLDCVGGDASKWAKQLKKGGRYASVLPTPGLFLRSFFNAVSSTRAVPVMLKPTAADLAWLDRLYAAGQLKVVIDSTFSLEQLAGAWERSITGRAAGKIVVEVNPGP
jgi:NADPH:quinone reductase-like Zn-dependent oxidoreductase